MEIVKNHHRQIMWIPTLWVGTLSCRWLFPCAHYDLSSNVVLKINKKYRITRLICEMWLNDLQQYTACDWFDAKHYAAILTTSTSQNFWEHCISKRSNVMNIWNCFPASFHSFLDRTNRQTNRTTNTHNEFIFDLNHGKHNQQ